MLFNDYVASLEKHGIFGDAEYKKKELRKTSVFKVSREFMEKEIHMQQLTPEQEELVHDDNQFLLPFDNMWIETSLSDDEAKESNLSDEERRHGILVLATKEPDGKRCGILIQSVLGVGLVGASDYFSNWGGYAQISEGKIGCFYVIQKDRMPHNKLQMVMGSELENCKLVGKLFNSCVPFYSAHKEMIGVPIMAVRKLAEKHPNDEIFKDEADTSWVMFSKVFNIIMCLLWWINSPKTYIIKEQDPNSAKLEARDRKQGVIRKRNVFTVLSHDQVRIINPVYNLNAQSRLPHARRGHWRSITGRNYQGRWIEYSKDGCINGKKWIDEMWVGPKDWEYKGKRYVLVAKRGMDYGGSNS